jgi:branched-chain amino acid transport system substrate-binding protein
VLWEAAAGSSALQNLKFQLSNLKFRFAGLGFVRPGSSRLPCSQISDFKLRFAGALLAILLVSIPFGFAQAPPQPYAVMPRDAVNYTGPGRDARHDLEGSEVKIGFLAPLSGPQQDEGKALLLAAQLAIEDEAASPLAEGRRLSLVSRDQSGSWGRATNEIVHLVYEDRAVAIITSLDGASAHLAEQVANKVGIPVVTLSTDPATTQINLPWIFRLGPTDTQQASAFVRDIYVTRKLKRVVLVMESGHDGRVGDVEFQKAARQLNAFPVAQLLVDTANWEPDALVGQIMAQKPEALVLWTGPEIAARVVSSFREAFPTAPIYLCHQAAQGRFATVQENIWIVATGLAGDPLHESFAKRFRARAGTGPIPAAAQAYDAVRILAGALRRSGPNRARVRDALAALTNYSGVSGVISFDHAGNDLSDITLVRLP